MNAISCEDERAAPISRTAFFNGLGGYTNVADLATVPGLSLTFDTGGEVFERIAVATAKPPVYPNGSGTGVLKPRSIVVDMLADPESACSGIRHQYHFW
jgi:hypothetical protein